jgi:multidrug efflux pump subunit AcrA (membrane-fusion protein)
MDERSYLRYQRLLRQHQVKGPGSPLYLGLQDEAGFPHQGTLKGFDDRIDPETGTVQAHGSVPNPDRLLLPGMFVRVRIPFAKKEADKPLDVKAPDKGKPASEQSKATIFGEALKVGVDELLVFIVV